MTDDQGPFSSTGVGVAMRIGLELVIATTVGGGLGLLGDRYFGTQPWLMLVGIVLGVAAGFRNIQRAIQQMQDRD